MLITALVSLRARYMQGNERTDRIRGGLAGRQVDIRRDLAAICFLVLHGQGVSRRHGVGVLCGVDTVWGKGSYIHPSDLGISECGGGLSESCITSIYIYFYLLRTLHHHPPAMHRQASHRRPDITGTSSLINPSVIPPGCTSNVLRTERHCPNTFNQSPHPLAATKRVRLVRSPATHLLFFFFFFFSFCFLVISARCPAKE
jgi:hypothetical protein